METIPSSSQMPAFGSNLPSLSFGGQLSNFLRTALADEDSRQLSEDMQQLALQAEGVVAGLRLSRDRNHAAPLLMDMLTVLRDHHGMVANLPIAWRGLYEHAGYVQALNNFRVQIGQWLRDVDPWGGELRLTPEEFGLLAWRTVGEGMLLVDMYQQWLDGVERPGASDFAALEPQQQWWRKLRR